MINLSNINSNRLEKGFTLVEMLVTILLVALVTISLVMGVNAATNGYRRQKVNASAQILAGTLNNTLKEPFEYMRVDTAGRQYIVFQDDTKIYEPHIISREGKLYIVGQDENQEDMSIAVLNDGAYGDLSVDVTRYTLGYGFAQVELDISHSQGLLVTYENQYTFFYSSALNWNKQ